MTDPMTSDASAFVQGKVVPVTYCVGPKDDSMITAANTLEASPKPSYGPHKASERYLDDEDVKKAMELYQILVKAGTKEAWLTHDMKIESLNLETVGVLLQALETLRTHLRKKYYGG